MAVITEIYTTLALSAAQKFEINTDTSHLDSSSFYLHGKYEQELPSLSFSSTETDRNQLDNLGLAESVVQVNTVWIFGRRKVVMVQEKQV
ncbi:hypothetical protein [Microcoleus sp. D2_18a_D3]|uniref:hypothetical protein n=1 Tax=Microcoleus sp. D2_18a_D3 TaxID=3055330 RepID=UPI002FD5E36E